MTESHSTILVIFFEYILHCRTYPAINRRTVPADNSERTIYAHALVLGEERTSIC